MVCRVRILIMRANLKTLRWVLLALYVAVVITVLDLTRLTNSLLSLPHIWEMPFEWLSGSLFEILLVVVALVSLQALFILLPWAANMHRPIPSWRLAVSVAIASLAMPVLAFAVYDSAVAVLVEFLDADILEYPYAFWAILGLILVICSVGFFVACRYKDGYTALKNLVCIVIIASVAGLLVTISSHIAILMRGSDYGWGLTSFGIAVGIVVTLWAFGSGIMFLFTHEKSKSTLVRKEKAHHGA